jgi:hypothetical protein
MTAIFALMLILAAADPCAAEEEALALPTPGYKVSPEARKLRQERRRAALDALKACREAVARQKKAEKKAEENADLERRNKEVREANAQMEATYRDPKEDADHRRCQPLRVQGNTERLSEVDRR